MEEKDYRYRAFISYRHVKRDRKWAKWIMTKLETFRCPKEMVDMGIAQNIGKIFRDDDEIPASSNLGEQLETALRESEFLIVICSPDTPLSVWVRKEISFFIALGRRDKIIPLLVKGEPENSFPPELLRIERKCQGGDGTEETYIEEVEPLAADVRPREDEKQQHTNHRAFIRIAASLLHCRFDDLEQRDLKRKIKQTRRTRIFVVVALMVVFVLVGGTIISMQEAKREKLEKEKTERLRVISELDEIKMHSSFIENLASKEGNPLAAALIVLEAWNFEDPRPSKKYSNYLELNLSERIPKLIQDWQVLGQADPDLSKHAAILRDKISSGGEYFFRQYIIDHVVTSYSKDESKLSLGYDNGLYYIEDLTGKASLIWGQANDYVKEIVYTNDSKFAYIITPKDLIKIQLNNGTILYSKQFKVDEINLFSFSHDKKYIAIAHDSGALVMMNLVSGEFTSLMKFITPPPINWASRYLFVAKDNSMLVLNPLVKDKVVTKLTFDKRIKNIQVDQSRDSLLITLIDDEVKIIIVKENIKATLTIPDINKYNSKMKIDIPRNLIFSIVGNDEIEIRNFKTQEKLKSLVCNKEIIDSFNISSNKKYIAAGTEDGQICIWDFEKFEALDEYKVTNSSISQIRFATDTKNLYFTTSKGSHHAWQWKRDVSVSHLSPCEDEISSLLLGPDGNYLFSRPGFMGICRWDLNDNNKLTHMPSFRLSTKMMPFARNLDKMVVSDRHGVIIEGSYPDLQDPQIYSAGDVIFNSGGYSISGTHIIGESIDGGFYIWKHGEPEHFVVLSKYFSQGSSWILFSDPNYFITLIDSFGDGYVFDPVTGNEILKIDMPLKISAIAVDLRESAIIFVLANQQAFSIPFDKVTKLSPLINKQAGLKIFHKVEEDVFGVRMAKVQGSYVGLVDLATSKVIFRMKKSKFNVPNISNVSYRQKNAKGIFVASSIGFGGVSPIPIIYHVPEIVGRAYADQAIIELKEIKDKGTKELRILTEFWQAEANDWVYKAAIKSVNRCLTTLERTTHNLKSDPPCWCDDKPYPTRQSWKDQLGYDPFVDKRADGLICINSQLNKSAAILGENQ